MSRKLGISLALGWAICLVIAFIIYPKSDNLVVSYPVYLAFGEDGVEHLSGIAAFAISAIQVLFVFFLGCFVGRLIWRERSNNGLC